MKIKIRVKTKSKQENDRQPWKDEFEQYKKMEIYIVKPRYTELGCIEEYIGYPICRDCISATVESGHLSLIQHVWHEGHIYTQGFKFSDVDSGEIVNGVYFFSDKEKAAKKRNELNGSLKRE